MDLGSGGGLPAIPLAIAGIGGRWVLVESRRTKCLFLRRAVQELGLGNVTVQQSRIEDLVGEPELASRFLGFTSRATMDLEQTLELAAPFVRAGGAAYLWKGSRLGEELATHAGPAWRHDWTRSLGDTQAVIARFMRL
jgi:16S rRNA (guanine527-N7)-methyltransferase